VRFVKQWSFEYQSWFRFTTQSFITSYEDLLVSYKSLAFKRIGERLYDYLIYSKELSENKIHISHKALANELGTTREVISRLLKQMEEEGRLKLHFKMIELIKS
jgi:CRP/FNR family transcriptional regulator